MKGQLVCKRCGTSFDRPNLTGRPPSYCSPSCGNVEKSCPSCGEIFSGRPEQNYCSDPCRFRGMSERNRSDPAAQSERGKLGGAARAASRTLGPNSYRKTKDGRHEHRAVAEKILGRTLRPGEVVHHEDLNKHNNDPANLIVFETQAEHARHHKLGHPGLPECACAGLRLIRR